jgi:hypothetical protein
MGLFKDLRKLNQMGKEMRATMPSPAGQMAQVSAWMHQQTEAARQVTTDGVAGVATVLSAVQVGQFVNHDPTIHLHLLVTAGPLPAYPITIQSVVPQLHLARIQPGAVIPVDVARNDPSTVLIAWNRPL